jgi:beta-glucosidase
MNGHKAKYMDDNRPIQERVDDLLSRMTLEEKISQMVYDAPAIERLDIPAYNWWNECLHGVGRAGIATVFPQAIGLAATWNAALMERVAEVISDEARAKHHEALRRGVRDIYTGLTFWSPNINIFRDPRWGRGQETYGEDPYLAARMGVAFVRGLQGEDARYLKLVATPKHYVVHSGPEPERHHFNAQVSLRELHDTYLPAFEACVKEGGAVSVMGAYNRTNGEPCCASPVLLDEMLRREWGFDGYVVSDCGAIHDIHAHHQVVETPAQAAALAVKAGCDLNCGATYPALREAVEQGLIDEGSIDRALGRLLSARFRLGMFDPPEQVPYAQIPPQIVNSVEHQALARQAARESIVLLKNADGLLPLSKEVGAIAVIGPNADDQDVLLGNYNGTPEHAVSPLEAIRRKVAASTAVYYARGCEIASGVPALEPVPPSCLRPPGAGASETGLAAAYFDNLDFEGGPALERVDALVDFRWKGCSPLGKGHGPQFSVRWTGGLIPPVSGTYRLAVNAGNRCALYLDGDQVIGFENPHHPMLRVHDVTLEAGRLYDVRLEVRNRGMDPHAQLLWAVPGVDHAARALEVAKKGDVVVLVMGITPQLEGEEMLVAAEGFAGGDRVEIDLPAPQRALVQQIHALGKPLVLVLLNGGALAVNWAAAHVPTIVEAWYPGQAGGEAIADVLFGDYNPAGRLPVTFYRSLADLPPFEDYSMRDRTYRYFRGEPLFPFGHGLSYTDFSYSALTLSAETVAPDQTLVVSVDVQNVGRRAGDEVVQLYVSDLAASVPVPIRSLQGFRRIHLAPGERRRVTFTLLPAQFSLVDEAGQRSVEPGKFQLAVGGRQPVPQDLIARNDQVLIANFNVAR